MQQLALFDTSSVTIPNSKPGDWAKLRRKSTTASYWKKGEVVQIEAVHPQNGSVRFWNERTETWGYLWPGDFFLVPPPLDSVSVQPIARDTESNCQHSETDTMSRVNADTESICPHSELDSVSVAPLADTESIPEGVEFVPGPVARYRPKGTARGGEYFRFSYRAGEKMKHLHIPGGNTGSVLAQSRAAEVMELAAAGVPSLEICDRIKSWSKRNHLETE
jgi:hypothetical protein